MVLHYWKKCYYSISQDINFYFLIGQVIALLGFMTFLISANFLHFQEIITLLGARRLIIHIILSSM